MTMMRKSPGAHPDQLPLDLVQEAAVERLVEARLAARAEAEAWHWRFRLVAIETVMIAALVAIAGFTLGQPTNMVLQAALLVGASCFASGLLLLSLSVGTGKLWSRFRRWRAS
jgi:hypothetical protein